MESFHHRLHQAMQQKHITQSDLCAKTGISRSTMSQYCSGASDYHYHTVTADSEETLRMIEEELRKLGFLVEN